MNKVKEAACAVAVFSYGMVLIGLGVWGMIWNGLSDGDYLGR